MMANGAEFDVVDVGYMGAKALENAKELRAGDFRAALVCSRVMVLPSTSTARLTAEMMPLVMVPRSSTPRGLPMA